MQRVLVVDDEAQMRQLIRIYLKTAGYMVEEATDGYSALEVLSNKDIQMVVLDLMMPGMDGYETCQHIRQINKEIPILMLTARTRIDDKITGFTLGADDYLTKPFDGRELTVRAKALLRRAHMEDTDVLSVERLGLRVDLSGRTVIVRGRTLSLTPKEFDLLVLLVRHPGRTYTREEILQLVWDFEYEGESRTVDSHVKNLREKFRDAGITSDPLKTVWSVGYKFEVEP